LQFFAGTLYMFILDEVAVARRDGASVVQKLYLVGRPQYVHTESSPSSPAFVVCGVPQGLNLFLLYPDDLLSLIEGHGLHPHLNADDTQICGFYPPSTSQNQQKYITLRVLTSSRHGRVQIGYNWTPRRQILGSTFYNQPASSSATAATTTPCLLRSDHVISRRLRPRKVLVYIDSDVSLRSPVAKTVLSCHAVLYQLCNLSLSVKIRRPVVCVVSRPLTAGLW